MNGQPLRSKDATARRAVTGSSRGLLSASSTPEGPPADRFIIPVEHPPEEVRIFSAPTLDIPTGRFVQPGHHEPTPYAAIIALGSAAITGGVRCTCGEDFCIGRSMPDTPKGKPSRRKLRTMKHCWDAYREHWRPDS